MWPILKPDKAKHTWGAYGWNDIDKYKGWERGPKNQFVGVVGELAAVTGSGP